MIELQNNELIFRFPEVHDDAVCSIGFQRTLRIPDDNRSYSLPPGLGNFPLDHVDDYAARVPEQWSLHGGGFLPMYQAEAMWITFSADYPMAVKIAAGKINAVNGEPWSNALSQKPSQDYVVLPDQPWLDGFFAGKGLIRQFVAMPLGEGFTAEEQITGEAEHGGLQIVVYPLKKELYKDRRFTREVMACMMVAPSMDFDMGLAPGGLMQQEIYEDERGIDAWDTSTRSRCFVHILNSVQYQHVTGRKPPSQPPTARQYTAAGLPWFEYYDSDKKALEEGGKLPELDSVAATMGKQGKGVLEDNEPVNPKVVKKIKAAGNQVREGSF